MLMVPHCAPTFQWDSGLLFGGTGLSSPELVLLVLQPALPSLLVNLLVKCVTVSSVAINIYHCRL